MEKTDYLIIGNSAAGINAAEAIREQDGRGKIIILTEESYLNYSKPLITYYLAGKIPIEQTGWQQADFYSKLDIDIRLNTKIVHLDADQKKAISASGDRFGFKKALIATGGSPIIPAIEVDGGKKLDKKLINRSENIFTLTTLEDAHKLKAYIEKNGVEKATILGGGLIGLKAAEAFLELGLKIELIELSDRILSATFDKQASSIVEKRIKDLNSNIFTQKTIEKIYMDDNRITKAQLTDGSNIDCQVLVVAVGVAPEIPFVDSGALDTDRGIKVDQFMETSAPGIFAAGDVVQARDILAGEDRNIAIWPLAVMQGKTAGLNMAGSRYPYGGGFFMNSVEILGVSSISMGLTSLEPDDSRKVEVLSQFKPESNYYKKIIIRENKVVGAILVGAIERAGIYAGLIKNGIDVGNIRDNIISENFGLIQLPADYQKHLVVGEGIEV